MQDKYDAGDEVKVRKRKTKAQLEEERCQEELRQILSTPGGRYWIWRLLSECGVFRTMSEETPHKMAVFSGLRDAGLWTLAEVFAADKNAFQKMQLEANEREN